MPKWSSMYPSNVYWERSTRMGYTTDFCNVTFSNVDDGADFGVADAARGIAPHLCI